jgi:peptidoglycan/xylan/chitin deacetylase (PgdA/CDA1 family)
MKTFALTSLLALSLFNAVPAAAQTVALTFDDGPTTAPTPLKNPQQRNQAILAALARYKIRSVLFVTAANGANRADGYALAKAWGDAGHLVGNHTMTHPDLDNPQVSLAQYQQEILDCDAVIRTLPGYRKWFRYTFIHLGNTPEKRDGMRAFLKQQGYADAPVSFDVQDWTVDPQILAALQRDPKADLTPIKRAYLDHVRAKALANKDKAPREQVQVLLLHHNLVNALWLDEVIGVFAELGWKFAPAADVLAASSR